MSRVKFSEDDEAPDIATHRLRCVVCQGDAGHDDALRYGGRCFRCYDRYLSEHTPTRVAHPADAIRALAQLARDGIVGRGDPKAWARNLRARELACERLTEAQRKAWRTVLKDELEGDGDGW